MARKIYGFYSSLIIAIDRLTKCDDRR